MFLWMRCFLVTVVVAVFTAIPVQSVRADDEEDAERPDEFPSVPLTEDSAPRYAAVYLDPWREDILYVMFDGNRAQGYQRMYAWIPGSRDYANPEPLRVDADHNFRTISWQSEKDGEIASTAYTFRSWRTTGTHRPGTRIDYITGEREVRADRPFTNINIMLTLDYMRDRSPRGGANRLQISIPSPPHGHTINLSTNLAGAKPQALWENVDFYWDVDRRHARGEDRAQLYIQGRATLGRHRHARAIILRSVPDGFFDLDIRIAPYMRSPIFQEIVPAYELVHEGMVVDVPFGWYTISYSVETHPWLGARKLERSTDLRPLGPYRPASAPLRDDASPASRLRGPPPSQLRGGR